MSDETKQLFIAAVAVVIVVLAVLATLVVNTRSENETETRKIEERSKACLVIEDPTQRIVCVQTVVRP